MKLWITGSRGFLGKVFQNLCKRQDIPFLATTKEEVDISNLDQVHRFVENESFTHIVNSAALAHVDLAEKHPNAAFQANVKGPENLGKVADQFGIPILHFSTEYVFNGSGTGVFKETDTPQPVGMYATTKYEGELRLLSVCSKACVVRTSWLFGGNGKTFLSSVFEKLKNEKLLQIASDQKGRATYIEDLVNASFFFFNQQGLFHFANSGEATRYQIAVSIREFAIKQGIQILCDQIIPKTSDAFNHIQKRPSSCILDTSKVEKLQKTLIRPWEEGVKDLVSHSED